MIRRSSGVLLMLGVGLQTSLGAVPLSPEQTDFFETKIRPVLAERCYKCHSTESGKDKGGLRLDTREALLKGGETGPGLVPGDPAKSLLFKVIRRDDPETAMPPKGKGEPLSAEELAHFEQWIKSGAPDPREGATAKAPIEELLEQAKSHWAFQAPKRVAFATGDGEINLIDQLLPAKQPTADARTLIRRASIALTGLPPTPARVEAFAKAYANNPRAAFNGLIDELLASPRYGERWARHWLDVARYADNMGAIFNGDDTYPFSFTYRDWVIQSLNEDKPYDRFVTEQLAADLLPDFKPEENRSLAALGFLTLGRRTDRRVDDNVYDDRIDVISRGLLGLTAGCARCHDHKLEPIPTTDYYALYGILRSSTEASTYPAMSPQPASTERTEFEQKNLAARTEFMRVHAIEAERSINLHRSRLGDYLQAARDGGMQDVYANKKVTPDILDPRRLNAGIYNRFVRGWDKWVKAHPEVFTPWLELSALDEADFGMRAAELCKKFGANADKKLLPAVARVLQKASPKTLRDIADCYNNLWAVEMDGLWGEKWRAQLVKSATPNPEELNLPATELEARSIDRLNSVEKENPLPEVSDRTLREALLGADSPLVISGKDFLANKLYANRDVAEGLRRNALKAVSDLATHPGAPIRLMALQEDKPYEAKVFVRGNPKTLGAPAPRGWFTALRNERTPEFPTEQSGRLQLAQLIASRDNPLTARVIVNRVWAWHFGEGIVRTPSDLGYRGERPTHPELLDTLAVWFMENGWSLKKLNRLIVGSALWQEARRTQPLDFESFRDSLLAVSNALDPRSGGRADDLSKADSKRRTIYAKVDRKTLPNLFRNFDFPDPSMSAPQRSRTALTPQALFLLNSSFVVDRARDLAREASAADGASSPEAKERGYIFSLYQRAFQRDPSEREVQRARAFLAAYPQNDVVMPEVNDWTYGTAELDPKTKRVVSFMPLKFSGNKVVGADGQELTNEGGQPGKVRSLVRRWIAPRDGSVNVYAELAHLSKEGRGVSSQIVSSRLGLLGEWNAAHNAVLTSLTDVAVQKGDTIDFLTTSLGETTLESFRWAPTITMPTAEMPGMVGMSMRWDAKSDFLDPSKLPTPLSGWEELAHVLLLSNEFAVVD